MFKNLGYKDALAVLVFAVVVFFTGSFLMGLADRSVVDDAVPPDIVAPQVSVTVPPDVDTTITVTTTTEPTVELESVLVVPPDELAAVEPVADVVPIVPDSKGGTPDETETVTPGTNATDSNDTVSN